MLKKSILSTCCAIALGLSFSAVQAKTKLSFGMQDPTGNYIYEGAQVVKETLEKLSGDTMTIELFPNSQLGDYKAMTDQLRMGELDLTANGYPDMSYIIPELQVAGAPYLIRDYNHMLKVLESDYGKEMNEKMVKKGARVLDVWYFGMRQTTSNRAINSISDMKGLKLRTPNVDFLVNYAKLVGASPAPIAFAEVYLALQTNQVDAQENPLPTIESMKFFEVQDYLAMTNHFLATKAIIVSEQTWKKLSEQEQNWLMQAILAGRETANAGLMKDEQELQDKFKEYGLTITTPDLAPFRDAMQPYYDQLDKKFGDGIVDSIRNVQ